MRKLILVTTIFLICTLFYQSCYVITPKSFNRISNNKAYDKGIDMLHGQSMQTQNLDSLYCNLNLFLETMAAYQPYFNDISFSNEGLQNVKKELIGMYNKFRSGNRTVFKSEIELRERIGKYIKAVIENAKSGQKEYESKGLFDLIDLRPNKFNNK